MRALRKIIVRPRAAGLLLAGVLGLGIAAGPAHASLPPNGFTATAGVPFTGVIGGFNTTCPGNSCQGLNPFVTIDWGDGTPTSRVAAVPDCPVGCASSNWSVSGTHTYRLPGAYPASFFGVLSLTVSTPATVGDDPNSIVPSPVTVSPVVGAPFSGVVATFTDTNQLAQASDFTATINWGDGQITSGTVALSPTQGFQVAGSHTYARVGAFPVAVKIQHLGKDPGVLGATATDASSAHVTDAVLTGAPSLVSAVAGVPFRGAVATFADPNPFATASDFSATITWGNEGPSAGTVAAVPGGFEVVGSHTFATSGQKPITVLVIDNGGSRATINGTAVVRPAPPPPTTTVALSPAAPNGNHGWYRSTVHVAVSADSPGSTVTETRCMLDGAAVATFADLPARCPFAGAGSAITGDGRHVLHAASVNAAGQTERPSATSVPIDTTPPTLACSRTAPAFVRGTTGAFVRASVRDATSGPVSQTVSVAAAVSAAGRKAARLTARDNAGNSATITCGYRVLGQIHASMQWRFDTRAASTAVSSLVVNEVPVRGTIRVLCRGAGCPAAARTLRVAPGRACRAKGCHGRRRQGTAAVNLTPLFHGRRLPAGTVVTVTTSEPSEIGKGFVFTMRLHRQPKVVIGCLAPASHVPGRGC